MAPDAERRLETDALPAETPGRLKDFGRHHAVLDDFLVVVDVVDEQIQGSDALLQAALDHHPVRCRHNPRQQIERKDAFGAGAVAVHVERDAHVQERALGGLLPPQQLAGRKSVNEVREGAGGGSGPAVRTEHLVEEVARVVALESHTRGGQCPVCAPRLRLRASGSPSPCLRGVKAANRHFAVQSRLGRSRAAAQPLIY